MHRATIGWLAVGLGVVACFVAWIYPAEQGDALLGGLLRVGVMLGALWLALPDLRRIPRWLGLAVLVAVAGAILLARASPRFFMIAAGVSVLYLLIRSQAGKGGR